MKREINSLSTTANVAVNIVFVIFTLICIIPLFLLVSVSFTEEQALVDYGYKFFPVAFSMAAYERLFSDTQMIFNAYTVTIISTVVGSVVNVAMMALYAYPLAREDFPFRRLLSGYVLITVMVSGGLVAQYMVNVTILKIKDTMWALVLPSLCNGFHIFVMRTYFKESIPTELIDAAKIDGASEIKTFYKIIVPIVRPILAAMIMYSVFIFWNEWRNSLYYITDKNLYTLQYVMQQALLNLQFIQQNLSDSSMNMSEAIKALPVQSVRMAMVVVGVGPIILAYPFFQKYFIHGLTAGAVKG